MNNDEFERFVLKFGKDILRFCRMTAGDAENGDELYQDTMLKLLEKKKNLDSTQNTKSYALSTSIYLWKNKKKKYANRMRLVPIDSMDKMSDEGYEFTDCNNELSPEHMILKQNEADMIQGFVNTLPEKYRIPIYLYYSANMQINEISKIPGLPEGTVKSRLRKAKKQLKEKLEATGYDGCRDIELLGWSYEPCYTICFNQDEELLYADMKMAGKAVFAVQGKEIKTLYVYIFDNLDDWSMMEQEGMNSSVADRAVISKEILVE